MQAEVPGTRRRGRPARLSRERILLAALAIADADGLPALTMQRVGEAIGAESMSLYRHVRNKDDLLDGLIDIVFGEIEPPAADAAWKPAMRDRAISARESLRRHPWAIGLMELRARPGSANLAHHDAVLACLFGAGFTATTATRAYNLIDSFVYGFALQEKGLPFGSPEELAEVGADMLQQFPTGRYPFLERVAMELIASGFRYGDEFAYGLDLILDGIERDHGGRERPGGPRPARRPRHCDGGAGRPAGTFSR